MHISDLKVVQENMAMSFFNSFDGKACIAFDSYDSKVFWFLFAENNQLEIKI